MNRLISPSKPADNLVNSAIYLVPTLRRGNAYGAQYMGRSRYLSIHSTRTASCYDADGIALDSRGFHVCDYAAANRTYVGLT